MGVYAVYLSILPAMEGVSPIGYIIEGCGLEGDYDALSTAEKDLATSAAIDECRDRMASLLAIDHYYCEYCGAIYHRDSQQRSCGRCNRLIGDNQIVEVEL